MHGWPQGRTLSEWTNEKMHHLPLLESLEVRLMRHVTQRTLLSMEF